MINSTETVIQTKHFPLKPQAELRGFKSFPLHFLSEGEIKENDIK
jgi:hypothetical protein